MDPPPPSKNLLSKSPVKIGLKNNPVPTFHFWIDPRGQADPSKLVVEDLVALQVSVGVVRDLDARRQTVEDLVALEPRMALGADQDASLRVAEDLIFFKDTYR